LIDYLEVYLNTYIINLSCLKRSSKIVIISGITVAVIISAIALTVHYRLSAIEGNEQNKNETAGQIAKEIAGNITGSKAHSEASESAAQHAKELNP
jgi:hypothetical protein